MKKRLLIIGGVLFFLLLYLVAPSLWHYIKWQTVIQAAGNCVFQIGLTNVVMTPCVTTGSPPVCTGGLYCNVLDAARCTMYQDVQGTPAGGMGSGALFSNIAISMAGLMSGGQLIACGISPTAMDNGALASAGGCYGCMAKENSIIKIANWLEKFFIAGFKQ